MNVLEFYRDYMGIPQKFSEKLLKIDHIKAKRNRALRKRVLKDIENFSRQLGEYKNDGQ